MVKHVALESSSVWVQIPAPLFSLSKSCHFSEPQFSYLRNGVIGFSKNNIGKALS